MISLNIDREQLYKTLLILAAIGTGMALVASMAHMVEVFQFANNVCVAWGLAVVMVLLNGVLIGLTILNREPKIKIMLGLGIVILSLVEFAGNYAAGGLKIQEAMPPTLPGFFGISASATVHCAAFVLSAFLPVLNFITVYALAETIAESVQEPVAPNRFAQELISIVDQEFEKSA